MTVYVDIGYIGGTATDPTVFIVGDGEQGVIGDDLIGESASQATTTYSSFDRVRAITVDRTSTRSVGPLVEYNAGTATVELHNADGALDPYIIEADGYDAPGVLITIRKVWDGVTYPIFFGYVDSWLPDQTGPSYGHIIVTATDGFSLLNTQLEETTTVFGTGENIRTRINRFLTAAGWPVSNTYRSIATADSTAQGTTFGGSGLELIQQAVRSEIGEFYQQPDGKMFFRNRSAMISDARSTTSQVTFGSRRDLGELPYVGKVAMSWDRTNLKNRVVATIAGGSNKQIAQDATSIGRYGLYSVESTDLILQTDAEALSWANAVLRIDVRPELRFESITLNGRLDDIGVDIMPHMLGRRMGDRVTVVRRPPAVPAGSIVDSREVLIRAITHQWSGETKQWITTFGLAPVDRVPFFVVGSATQGVIGQNALSY